MTGNRPVYSSRNHAYSCRCQSCRNRAAYSGSLAGGCLIPALACAVIAGLAWVAFAPLRIWHVTGADGQQHPDTTTWIAYGISGGILFFGLMFISIRLTGRRS